MFRETRGNKTQWRANITSLFTRFLMNNLASIQNLCERLWIFFTGFATRYLITHRLELHLSSNKITKMYFRPQHLIIFRCFLESKKRVAVLAEPVKIPDHQDPISSTTRFRFECFSFDVHNFWWLVINRKLNTFKKKKRQTFKANQRNRMRRI